MLITLAIVGADEAVEKKVRRLEAGKAGVACRGRYANTEEAAKEIQRSGAAVALVDLRVIGTGPAECIRALREASPDTRLLMLSLRDEHEKTYQALAAGASGYLFKPLQSERLLQAIKDVSKGSEPMSPEIAQRVIQAFESPPPCDGDMESLSPREREILGELATGSLYKEIAAKLGLSYGTVHTHVERIYRKLHVHSRAQATARYFGQ
jgi:DNA-binding NarL/FixJ family response regulator